MVVTAIAVAVFVAVMLAPGIAAPVASKTVPLIAPLPASWALAEAQTSSTPASSEKAIERTRNLSVQKRNGVENFAFMRLLKVGIVPRLQNLGAASTRSLVPGRFGCEHKHPPPQIHLSSRHKHLSNMYTKMRILAAQIGVAWVPFLMGEYRPPASATSHRSRPVLAVAVLIRQSVRVFEPAPATESSPAPPAPHTPRLS